MKLIERILEESNVRLAQEQVIGNRGAGGVDGMSVDQLVTYMTENYAEIKRSILAREYRPHDDSVDKFIRKLKKLCKRSWSISMDERLQLLNWTIRGWINYFAIGSMKNKMEKIDEHLRTMLRKVIWKQWKTPKKRAWGLRKLGINNDLAKLTSYCGNRYEWVVRRTCVARAISKEVLTPQRFSQLS